MRNDTRARFNTYVGGLAAANGVDNAAQKFAVTPSVQQRLETKIQDSSEFLKLINIMPVTEMMGERLGLGVTGPIASRTNTKNNPRKTQEVGALDGRKYLCAQTNYDTHIKYNTLDSWAKFPDFAARVSAVRLQRCSLDRIMIGFNGISVAADTDRVNNPMLEDVNKGWLQDLRENAPQRVLASGKTAGKIVVGGGAGADYKSLDGLVYDAAQSLLEPWHSQAGDLVVITGRNLLNDKLFPLVNDPKAPTETLAADIVRSQRRLGGLPAITVPFFPDHAVLVTSLANLSIYYQEGARRMHVKEAPEWDRIETYESSNDAFVIEDLGKAALVEKIEITD